jgi:RNA polymerase sigma factor (sigma-70 family)
MSFPETRITLIQRLASGGDAEDWQGFLRDYWGPVCRFALRSGAGQLSDAEDVASETFAVLWQRGLLVRWVANRTARLRSLLCGVTQKILANRYRVKSGRERLNRDTADQWAQPEAVESQQAESFYAAWVEDLLRQALDDVAAAYYREAKGDYVRVLYSRLCEEVSMADMAAELGITPSSVNNYFRHARERLGETLKVLLRRQIERYSRAESSEREFEEEWQRLGEYLGEHGGLEEAVRRSYQLMDPAAARHNQQAGLRTAVERLTSVMNRAK